VRAELVEPLLAAVVDDEWFFDTELLLVAEYNGLRIHEVPVDWVDDADSRVEVFHTAWADIKGVVRLATRFVMGHGSVDLGAHARGQLDDDFGRRVVSFALIGTLSTAITLALFLALRGPIGSLAAVVVALAATTAGNSWAHRRYSVGRRSGNGLQRHVWSSGALALATIALSVVALIVVEARGGGVAAEVGALLLVWAITTPVRIAVLSRERR
jgi:putative flippase GtrA